MRLLLAALLLLLPQTGFAAPKLEEPEPSPIGRPIDCINAYTMGTFSEALVECAIAAQTGNPEAMTFMGGMYYKGQGVEQDYKAAADWYRKAADKGWPEAQFSLAKMLEKGEGVPQDYTEAFALLEKAAKQDYLFAIYNIGFFYGKGYVGGKPNYEEAAKWFTKAADRRHGVAMYGLANLYIMGAGVEKDMAKALMWLKLASKYGVSQADVLAGKIRTMATDTQVTEADKLAEAWEKEHP